MNRKDIEDIYPLSPMQQGMLFHSLHAPETGMYFEQTEWILRGDIDIPALERAWQAVIRRHSSLRTAFVWEGVDQFLQVVFKQVAVTVQQCDWTGLSVDDQRNRLEEFLKSDKDQGFKLSDAPLMRLAIIRTGAREYHFVWSHHHILLDGWSVQIVVRELFTFYEAFCEGQDIALNPPRQFKDYISWLQRQDMAAAETFWRRTLTGLCSPTHLIVHDCPDQSSLDEDYRVEKLSLSDATTKGLRELVRQRLTLNTVIQGAWALLLSRYSSERDVIFGATVAGRPGSLPGVESMVGLFINTLPVRIKVERGALVSSWLRNIQDQQAESRNHEYSPLVAIHGWSEIPRDTALFESLVVFENYPVEESLGEAQGHLSIEVGKTFTRTNYPVTLAITPGRDIGIELGYDRRKFSTRAVQRMLKQLENILREMGENPHRKISELSLLTSSEKDQALIAWNATADSSVGDCAIHYQIAEQAERTPHATAAIIGNETLSYAELNARANRLAHFLINKGVRPEKVVGVCFDRSLEMLIGLIGVLKAGAAYLPLEPQTPSDRLGFMIADSHVDFLLTVQAYLPRFERYDGYILCLDADWLAVSRESDCAPPVATDAQSLAYVIYTSGSTGKPKGVAVHHRGLVNHAHAAIKTFALRQEDKVLQFLPFCFDAFGEELYPTLLTGATLVLHRAPMQLSPRELTAFCEQMGVTVIHFPATYWHHWMSELELHGLHVPACARLMVVGGEISSLEKLGTWMKLTNGVIPFVNAYGPTETTIAATMYMHRSGDGVSLQSHFSVPIGRPLPNVRVYVLDVDSHPAPIGIPGKLYIGGAGVARGYLNMPDVTAERFVPDPFSQKLGARLYDTGDRACYLPDGNIEFLGRLDDQVKIRGFRVELGEIEGRLKLCPGLQDAAVVFRADSTGEKQLVAYVVPQGETRPTPRELQDFLKQHLPEYMIPFAFVILGKFPQTSSGKVDRQALPAPDDAGVAGQAADALRAPTEELLAGAWTEVLKIRSVGADDNFFDLGGHSILATQLLSRIRDIFSVELPLRTIFDNPTLTALARSIDAARLEGRQVSVPPLVSASVHEEAPLSFAQQRLWFIDQLDPGGISYNIFSAYRLTGPLNLPAFEQSLNEVVRRHEVLRTSFSSSGGKPVQIIAPHATVELPVHDLTEESEDGQEARLMQMAREEASRPFDLRTGPLLRAHLVGLGPEDHALFLTIHHIIADGWSMVILTREVAALYQAFSEGKSTSLPELQIQYADFATWQRQWLQGEALETQLSYWKEQLAGAPPAHEMPTDHQRPAAWTFRGGRLRSSLSCELSGQIATLARTEGVTRFMALLAAFQTFLHRYSGQLDIVVGSPIAGRRHTEVENLVGFFVNTLVLRTTFERRNSFKEILRRVRETTLGAYAHQDIPFEKLVEELHPMRDLSHPPIFQIMFVLQNLPADTIELPGLTIRGMNTESPTSAFDLTLVMQETPDGYILEFEYNADLFASTTIKRMMEHFKNLLGNLVRNPDWDVAMVPLLSTDELQQQLVQWNESRAPYPDRLCVHEMFERVVAQHADATAVLFTASGDGAARDKTLSYEELNRRANQLGRHLRKRGIGTEHLVGICMERSVEMVVGIMGTLKAGAAFVPLDPSYPQDRLTYMLRDSGIAALLTQDSLLTRFPPNGAHVIPLDSDWPSMASESQQNLETTTTPDSLAYVIYTSGSTGKPKGTMLRHGGLCNLATVHRREFDMQGGSRVLQFSSLSFDASVWELVMALLNGATLCLTRQDLIASTHDLVALLKDQKITTITLPPSVLAVFPDEPLADLHTIITAGEKCTAELVERWSDGRRFFNAYGPTETTVCASMHLCSAKSLQGPPIGRPIANFELYILDRNLQPVPVGVPGELHISGVGLARGYLNRPDITADRFIPKPFGNDRGARMYKSGDLCRYATDGTIEFLGRIDHQVKVRGFRIELGEIESLLCEYPGVRDVVVLAREDMPGDKRLVTYLVMNEGVSVTTPELKRYLREHLPEYMIPSAFVILDAMPLTPSKKIDRKALPAPDSARPDLECAYVAPRNETEAGLAGITALLLNVERVGINDNFFDLGGHSLLATQFISRVRDTFQVDIPLRGLFEKPTIAELAFEIERLKNAGTLAQLPRIRAIDRETVRVKRAEVKQPAGEPKN